MLLCRRKCMHNISPRFFPVYCYGHCCLFLCHKHYDRCQWVNQIWVYFYKWLFYGISALPELLQHDPLRFCLPSHKTFTKAVQNLFCHIFSYSSLNTSFLYMSRSFSAILLSVIRQFISFPFNAARIACVLSMPPATAITCGTFFNSSKEIPIILSLIGSESFFPFLSRK